MVIITDVLHHICTCCTNPVVYEEEEVFRRIPTIPTAKTSAVTDLFSTAAQEDIAPGGKSSTAEEGLITDGEGPTDEDRPTTEEGAATKRAAALKKGTAAMEDIATASNGFFITPLEDDVDQSEIFPVPWKDDDKTGLDLKDIPEVGAVVAKPEDVDQPLVHPVSWSGASKGATVWGGVVPTELESKFDGDEQKKLPLPWESGGKLTPVPYDGTTNGPSWEQQ